MQRDVRGSPAEPLTAVPIRVDWSVAQKVSDCLLYSRTPPARASKRSPTRAARSAASDTTVNSASVSPAVRTEPSQIESNRMRRLRVWPLPLLLFLALAALLLCTQTGETRKKTIDGQLRRRNSSRRADDL